MSLLLRTEQTASCAVDSGWLRSLHNPSVLLLILLTALSLSLFLPPHAGLYGLSSLLADLRGILTRFNPITDLLSLLDAPLENIINANPLPLPQVRVVVNACVAAWTP